MQWSNSIQFANYVSLQRILSVKALPYLSFLVPVKNEFVTTISPAVLILHRKCEIGPFLQSYPKRAFANPMALFALHVDQGKS